MGVTSKTVIKIECDNPNCPGNSLDPKSFDGWIRVNMTTQQTPATAKDQPTPMPMTISSGEQFFCSPACAASIQETLAAAEEARNAEATPV
jgi:hypothetical protein